MRHVLHCYGRGRSLLSLLHEGFLPIPLGNLELIAPDFTALGQGILCLQAWADMWLLQLDVAKSYVWGNSPECRKDLAILGWAIREAARDLGAQINYGRKRTIREQQLRLDSLAPQWLLLSRTRATDYQRCQLLYQAFWPKPFHGVSNCTLGWQHIVGLWAHYMHIWNGEDTQGPFGKLIEVMRQIGWAVQVPELIDQDGVPWDLTTCGLRGLRRTLEDSWIQKIAADVSHRLDFHGLEGIDYEVLQRAQNKLLPADRAWLLPLRDGTFIEPRQQAKYDLTRTLNCEYCGASDSVAHRTFECPAFANARLPFQDLVDLGGSVPAALRIRLLPSRNPHHGPFRAALAHQRDIDIVTTLQPAGSHIHLFTDGSCLCPELPSKSLTAYAVISATDDRVIAQGTIGGITQTSDLAELRAMAIAVEWLARGSSPATVWTDSAYVAANLQQLIYLIHTSRTGSEFHRL